MKTKLLSLFLVLTITCSAQTFKFISENVKDMRTIADSIVSNAKRTYKFSSESFVERDTYKIRYTNVKDTTDALSVFYIKNMKGENKNLETTGTPEYEFSHASGKFLDLYPFWKKYIDPKSTPEVASEQVNYGSYNDFKLIFHDYSGIWIMRR